MNIKLLNHWKFSEYEACLLLERICGTKNVIYKDEMFFNIAYCDNCICFIHSDI